MIPGDDSLTWRQWLFGADSSIPDSSQNAPLTGVDPNIEGAETGSLLDQPVPEDTKAEAEKKAHT